MKVKKLIKELKKMNPRHEVFIEDRNERFYEITAVTTMFVEDNHEADCDVLQTYGHIQDDLDELNSVVIRSKIDWRYKE